jgi:hypothetical protein
MLPVFMFRASDHFPSRFVLAKKKATPYLTRPGSRYLKPCRFSLTFALVSQQTPKLIDV